jgi:predicted nucleic-acid-binding Zn-ribbon protein
LGIEEKEVQQKGENRERILKAIREKKQITYKCKPIKITVDFSMETIKSKKNME